MHFEGALPRECQASSFDWGWAYHNQLVYLPKSWQVSRNLWVKLWGGDPSFQHHHYSVALQLGLLSTDPHLRCRFKAMRLWSWSTGLFLLVSCNSLINYVCKIWLVCSWIFFEIVHSLWCFVQQHDFREEHPLTPETFMLSLDISCIFF